MSEAFCSETEFPVTNAFPTFYVPRWGRREMRNLFQIVGGMVATAMLYPCLLYVEALASAAANKPVVPLGATAASMIAELGLVVVLIVYAARWKRYQAERYRAEKSKTNYYVSHNLDLVLAMATEALDDPAVSIHVRYDDGMFGVVRFPRLRLEPTTGGYSVLPGPEMHLSQGGAVRGAVAAIRAALAPTTTETF